MKKKTIDKIALKVLYLEDSPRDIEIIRELLLDAGYDLSMDCTEKKKEFTSLLHNHTYDLILSDFKLPGFDAHGALKLAKNICPEVPFICVSGSIGEETAIELIKQGAIDYVLKDRLIRLPLAIKRALDESKEKKSRQQSEEALHESEEKFRKIFEDHAAVKLLIDPESGEIIDANNSAAVYYGWNCEELKRMKIYQINVLPPEEVNKEMQKVKSQKRVQFEFKHRRKDGSIRDVEVFSSNISIGNKNVLHSIVHDITERKQVEKQVVLLAHTLKSIAECVSITDLNNIVLFVNNAFLKTYGYSEHEILGKNINVVRSLNNPPETTRDILAATLTGGWSGELMNRTKDGRDFPISLSTSFVRDEQGQNIALVGIATDITERKRAEETLKKSEKLLNETQKIAKVGGWEYDVQAHKANFSDEIFNIYGIAKDKLSSTEEGANFYYPNDRSLVSDAFNKAITNGEPYDLEARFINARGEKLWVQTIGIPILENGNVVKVIGYIMDITKRKRAEEALSKSEERYRGIFENVQDVYYEAALDGTILEVSPSIEIISKEQYHSDDLIGKSMYDFYSIAGGREAFLALLQGQGSVSDYEVMLKNRDGSQVPSSISAKIQFDANSTPLKIVGSMRDITERKRAEEELRETRDYLENLFSFTNAPIMVWDNTIRITRFNLAFERLTGYTMYDVIGKHPEMLFPDEKQKEISTLISRTSDGENLISFEIPIRCKNGSNRIVLWNTANIYTADGKTIISTIALGQDITERNRVEQELRESELRFRSLYENATIGLYRTAPEGNILLANLALVKMLGYSSFEKLAERNLKKDGFESSYQRKEFLEKIERDGEVIGHESKWICQDGTAIFVLESARAIRDSQGKTLYYDGTVEDITEQKQMEEGLRQMQKLEGLGTLAGGIAHDFNNILGIILGYNTSIKRFKDDPKKLDLATKTITKAVDRGKTLVQQILLFARKSETAFGALNVNDIVMETVTMVMETFPKFITCSQNFDKSISYINADRSQLHQVLMNLCINARDAMPKGGVLTINTRMVSVVSLRSQHPTADASSYVCIEVSDTGEGMTEETRKRIFEPFFTTKGIGKGTGLGLSVVFGVMQSHKGFIDVDSELGKGTTFHLYLPASQVAEPIIEKEEETLESIPGGTETLLVIEDEEMLMMPLQTVLVDKGYIVLSAKNGLEALKIYQENKSKIALVMTDLGLPDITGLEVCQQIKAINPNEHIILASGYIDPEMKASFLKSGIQHFLYKPYDFTEVLKVIREVLDEK